MIRFLIATIASHRLYTNYVRSNTQFHVDMMFDSSIQSGVSNILSVGIEIDLNPYNTLHN